MRYQAKFAHSYHEAPVGDYATVQANLAKLSLAAQVLKLLETGATMQVSLTRYCTARVPENEGFTVTYTLDVASNKPIPTA